MVQNYDNDYLLSTIVPIITLRLCIFLDIPEVISCVFIGIFSNDNVF